MPRRAEVNDYKNLTAENFIECFDADEQMLLFIKQRSLFLSNGIFYSAKKRGRNRESLYWLVRNTDESVDFQLPEGLDKIGRAHV